jgi:hypothetical protein
MRLGDEHSVKPCKCLNCEKILDAVSAVLDYGFDASPDPTDFTVCFDCGHVMGFAEDLSLRELTTEEIIKIAGDPRIIAIQKARARVKK